MLQSYVKLFNKTNNKPINPTIVLEHKNRLRKDLSTDSHSLRKDRDSPPQNH